MFHRKKTALLVIFLAVTAGLLWFFMKPSSPSLTSSESPVMLKEITPQDLLQKIKDRGAKVTLLNVWASWCAPCLEELPLLAKLREEFKGQDFELALYSADKPEDKKAALMFLQDNKIHFTNYFKGSSSMEDISVLFPGWEGVLPVSVLFDSEGQVIQKWMGTATYEEFKTVTEAALKN